ncbi:hypothetical protein OUZ56_005395 [Daphnia magna]|uniref:Uncharacterized protein n=1 Tax=Daphnia magna TaxID=35525 RepID=A0ABQ9YSR9_9CRUS|nr:hypothetical protein OUZ56_005395 [Daphnia magna]
MVKDESSAGKKISLLKRWGRSFRQSFPSFRTGPGPNQAAANQKYIDEQLEKFVDSHRRETQLAQQTNVLRNHAQSLFKDNDTEEERRELLRQASTLLHEADPSLTPSNQKRTSFHSQYWHSHINDIPEDELIFELQHHLEANDRFRLSDEHTRVSLLFLLALYPSLDTPARLFEFLNLRTGYTPVLPRSYDSSDSAPSIDAPTPPLRTDTRKSTEEWLIDLPTPDLAIPDPKLPYPTEFSSVTTSDPDTIEETPGKPTFRQETDKFILPTSTSSPITSPTMSQHHTLHPTPVSGPPSPTSIKTPSNRKVSFTPVLAMYGAGASKPSQVQASTFFETYEKELTRLLEAGVDTKTAVSTARTLAQAEQNQPTATADTLQGTTNPYPTSTLQGVTPLPVSQWGYNTPPPTRLPHLDNTLRALPTQRSGRFDDWAAHLDSALDLGNFEEARKLRLMRSKLYGEAAEEFDTFKLDNPIRSQEYAAVKARLFKLFQNFSSLSYPLKFTPFKN